MKTKSWFFITILISCFQISSAQNIIPTGTSLDSIMIKEILDDYHNFNFLRLYYYKPTTYNSLNSPIIFAIHGTGGDGLSPIADLQDIAERRNALIIAPNIEDQGYLRLSEPDYAAIDTNRLCIYYSSTTEVFKQLYRSTLAREGRDSASSFLIGFSAGGQFVTRYMLIRQAYPDSIPFRMAVSSNPYYYTFPTKMINAVTMPYPCGLLFDSSYNYHPGICTEGYNLFNFDCPEHIIKYYNENYGVLIGTADNGTMSDPQLCMMAQGNSRFQRAKNFYNFCDTNAISMGTTLKWRYDSVDGVGHDQAGMYNTKRNVTDSSSIAETLLFDTPFHQPLPIMAPIARFTADSTDVYLPNATVHFYNLSLNATSYKWDFGDGTTSTDTNPVHTYTAVPVYTNGSSDGYIVHLTAINSQGCKNWSVKRYYIHVHLPNEIIYTQPEFSFRMYPNPTTGNITISYHSNEQKVEPVHLKIADLLGKEFLNSEMEFSDVSIVKECDLSFLENGMYLVEIRVGKKRTCQKLIINK